MKIIFSQLKPRMMALAFKMVMWVSAIASFSTQYDFFQSPITTSEHDICQFLAENKPEEQYDDEKMLPIIAWSAQPNAWIAYLRFESAGQAKQ